MCILYGHGFSACSFKLSDRCREVWANRVEGSVLQNVLRPIQNTQPRLHVDFRMPLTFAAASRMNLVVTGFSSLLFGFFFFLPLHFLFVVLLQSCRSWGFKSAVLILPAN